MGRASGSAAGAPLRRRPRVAAAALGALCALGAAGAESWIRYRGDGFSVRVPAEPRVHEDQLDTPAGPQRVLILNSVAAGASYALTCTYYEQGLVASAGSERLLAAALARFMSETDGALIRERKLEILGHAGREVSFLSLDSQRITFVRLFLAGDRLFSLVGDVPRSEDARRQAERFFGSLELARPSGSH